jgi:hypothetical protein
MSRCPPALSCSLPFSAEPVVRRKTWLRALVAAIPAITIRPGRRVALGVLSMVMLVAALGGCFAGDTAPAPARESLPASADVAVGPEERPSAPAVGQSAEVDDANDDDDKDGDDDALDEAGEIPAAMSFVASHREHQAATPPEDARGRIPPGRLFRPPRA